MRALSDTPPQTSGQHARGRARADQSLRLWIEIVRFANRLQRDIDARLRQTHGQSLARFDVLSQLERAQRPLTVGELSAQLLTSTGNITGLLDRMERDGLLTRALSTTDRRSFLVEATPDGLDLFREMARDNA
ncbi:MAG: MarR family transcriptional regulator, partial [Pseudomonadota bacterium]